MKEISKLLCVIDPTQDTQPALQRAVWLAQQSGAAIDLVICYYDQSLSGERSFGPVSSQEARNATIRLQVEKLEALATPLVESGLDVCTKAVWDHPLHEAIAKQSIALKADIVFKDTHRHSALSRALLTNTDWSLIRTCPVPLWLVNHQTAAEPPVVIASIDPFNEHDKPASLDDEIISMGKSVAASVSGELHTFHSINLRNVVSEIIPGAYFPVTTPLSDYIDEIKEEHETRLGQLSKKHGIPAGQTHLVEGTTPEALPDFAKSLNATLVVMGAVSRNRLRRLFIGATAEQTMDRLPCDLLVVNSNPFSAP